MQIGDQKRKFKEILNITSVRLHTSGGGGGRID